MPVNNKVDEIIGEARKGPVDFEVYLVKREDGVIPADLSEEVPRFARSLLAQTIERANQLLEEEDEGGLTALSFLGLDKHGDGIGVMTWPGCKDELDRITNSVQQMFRAFGVERFARVVSGVVENSSIDGSTEEKEMLTLLFVNPPNHPKACFIPLDGSSNLDFKVVDVAEDNCLSGFLSGWAGLDGRGTFWPKPGSTIH